MKLVPVALVGLSLLVGCEVPQRESIHYGSTFRPDGLVDGAHCWRCNTVWGTKDTEYHEWHRRELNMMMYASGCKRCRYHGAYKDMEFPKGPLTFWNKDGSINTEKSGIYKAGKKIAPLPKK